MLKWELVRGDLVGEIGEGEREEGWEVRFEGRYIEGVFVEVFELGREKSFVWWVVNIFSCLDRIVGCQDTVTLKYPGWLGD